ncbi:Hypothetical predicted protein, partial [Mytilus galloprovincialis]
MRNDESNTCETDAGWLLVGDDIGNCQYEFNIRTKPFILFSDKFTSSKAEEFAVADFMAIFVKLKIKATCLNPFAMHCEHENSPSTTISVQTTSTNTIPIDEQSQSTVSTSKNGDQSTTMTSEELQNKIERIKMELTVQKKSTKKYRRSLTSAPDERTSSKLMGMIGGTFIISVIGFIVLLDCATCNMGRKANNLHIRFSRSEEECWALVFKIATGGNERAYDLFLSDISSNVNDKEAMSLQCSNNQVKKHFKSDIVNNWSDVEIDLVRISLYVSGIERVFFLFNGSETTKTSWFNNSRLINSSYSDLNKDAYFRTFSLKGIAEWNSYRRRFYIRNDKEGNCRTDAGWLLVGDDVSNCQYEKKIIQRPFILFCNKSTSSKVKDTCFDQLAMNCVHENSACITKSVHTSSTNTVLLDDQAQSTVSASKDEAQSTTMRNENLEKKIDRMKKELTVPKKSTQ